MDINFNARILELAQAQQKAKARNELAQTMRDRFYALYVQPYEDEIAANQKAVDALEDQLRADTLAYIADTGDLTPHPSLTFRRTKKLMYDKTAALEACIAREANFMIRRVVELDVRAFEHAWAMGTIPWAQIEEVPAPTVAIAKLGDVLIHHENETSK